MNSEESKITESINNVYNELKFGLTESIYQKALVLELKKYFENVETERSVPIIFNNHEITTLRADIIVDNKYILELKATLTKLSDKDECQLKRYMKILNIPRGFLINFGKELQLNAY